jgi:hypothetical protein
LETFRENVLEALSHVVLVERWLSVDINLQRCGSDGEWVGVENYKVGIVSGPYETDAMLEAERFGRHAGE